MYKVDVDERTLTDIVQRLVKAFEPDKIILFGSRARGDFHEQSDVDLLIIKDSQEPKHRRRGGPISLFLDLSPEVRQPVKTHNAAKGDHESWDCLAGSSHGNSN